jgi:hypothetical protein
MRPSCGSLVGIQANGLAIGEFFISGNIAGREACVFFLIFHGWMEQLVFSDPGGRAACEEECG